MILSGKESLLAHAKDAAADRIETPEDVRPTTSSSLDLSQLVGKDPR